jgi:hypothetical protein
MMDFDAGLGVLGLVFQQRILAAAPAVQPSVLHSVKLSFFRCPETRSALSPKMVRSFGLPSVHSESV